MLLGGGYLDSERQTRELLEGYDYLKELSSQVPASYEKMANFYREQMVNAASIISPILPTAPEDTKENPAPDPEHNLAMLRAELQSISHERVIVDVLTRHTMLKSKVTIPTPSSSAAAASSSASKSRAEYRVTSQSVPLATLTEYIPIPDFIADVKAKDKEGNGSGSGKKKSSESRMTTSVRKLPAGSVMVPSIMRGSIPPELRALHTQPTPAAPVLERRPAARPGRGKAPRTQVAIQGFAQAVKSFKTQLVSSQSDLEALKAHVDANLSAEKTAMHRQLKHMLNDVKQQQAETSEDLLGHVDRAVDAAMGKLAEMIKPLADQRVRATQAQQQALEAAMKHRVMVQVQQAQSQARLQEKTARQSQMLQIQQQQQQLQDMVRASQEREKRRGYGGKVRRDENEGEDERRFGAEPMSKKQQQQQQQQQQQKQQQQKQQLRQKQEQDQQRAPDDRPATEPRVNFAPSPRSSSGPLAQTQTHTQTRAHQQSSDTYRVITPRASGSGQAPPSRAVAVAASKHDAGPSKTNSFHSQTQIHNHIHNHNHNHNQGRTVQHQRQPQPQPRPQLQSRGEDLLQMAGGDRQGVRWATQPPPVADLVISSSIDNLAAPSVRDLQTIPGGPGLGAPSFASHEPVFHAASGVGHAQGQGQGQGVPLAQLPHLSRQLGVVAAQPVLVIAGNQRQPPSLWEQEREYKVRPKRGAALVTMDPFGQPTQDDNEEDDDDKECGAGGDEAEDVGKARPDYPVPTPESGFVDTEDGALEGPGAPFRGLDSFLSRVAPAAAPPTAANRAAAHSGAHNSSYAQERHLGRTVERLLGTVVESQKSLISEVVEGQVRIAEELKESSRATAKASAVFAAAAAASAGSSGTGDWAHPHTHAAGGKTAWNPADAGSVSGSSAGIGGGMSEEHILALVTQCMEKLAPRPESTASASQQLGGRGSASGEADHHQASQAAEKAAAAQAAAAAATAAANAAAAAAAATKEHAEAQMLLLEERLRSHLESEVRRGVGEGVDEGVRRALATFEAERESRERAAVAAASASASATADAAAATAASTTALGSVAATAAETQLAFRHVPLPFMAASAHHYSSEVLETLRADAAESGAALRALRVGLGSGGARGDRGDAAGAGRGRESHFARAKNSDEAWLDGEDEEEQGEEGEEGGGGRKAWLAAGVPAGLPQGALISSRASLKLEPEELSELYDEDDDANAGGVAGAGTGGEASSWSMSEDDGEAFLRRHVDDRLLLTDRARANLMQGGRL